MLKHLNRVYVPREAFTDAEEHRLDSALEKYKFGPCAIRADLLLGADDSPPVRRAISNGQRLLYTI